ncbi:ABC transporter substrate-binding protein [Aeromonas veronii]|uniref:ABC transporter substrate-binding protein n=1 Tax=Aeromonas veronii TaxID=654 RepID=UPI000957165C|nr:ABC transporter substrate-binding protein [Aeromonas veronii]SIR39605.1 phosphoglycerate transport regulatory protein PgtC [Aeromonas veronii]
MPIFCRQLPFLLVAILLPLTPLHASTLTVLTSFSEAPVKAVIEGFSQQYPAIRVEVIYRRTLPALRLLTADDAPGVDIIMSSSPTFFHTLDQAGLLAGLSAETVPPDWLTPHMLGLGNKVAVVGYSGSGIMYNRRYLDKYHLPVPTTWQQLASPQFMGHVMMSSPSQSGTTHMMVESVLQQYGWEQGWALLMRLGSNLSAITARSFGVSDGVTRGLAGAGLVIDSYARNSQARFDHVGFNILPDAVILPTYLGVARSSEHSANAARFIKYLLSAKGQAIIATPGMAKVTLNQPRLASEAKYVTDKDLLYRRAGLLKALFAQTITQQLPRLKLTWQEINGADTRGDPARERLLEQARAKASTPPLSELEASDPALLAQFDGLYDRDQSNPQTEKVMHQWRQAMESRLGEARLLVDQAVKP